MDRYLDTVGLKPGAMYRDYVRRAFEAKELKLENGKFIGADDVMKELKESPDYKEAFVVDTPDDEPDTPMFRMYQEIHRHRICRTSQQEPNHRQKNRKVACSTSDFLE